MMDCIHESPAAAWSGGAVAAVRGLLELSQLARGKPALDDTLDAVARIVADSLGFRTVVINTYRPDGDDYEAVTVRGGDRVREVLLGQISAGRTWEPLLDPRFLSRGVYFIREGDIEHDPSLGWYTPDLPPCDDDSEYTWRAGDALFATLDGLGGRRYGIISVDEPESGLRPDDQGLEVLAAIAAHAALAIESASQLHELEAALARNRAVIRSTLDCVIAVDDCATVIEFNPAAEQTFGYRSEDVLGRDLIDLLVVPESRAVYRRHLTESRRTGDWKLLGRRIETTALCAGGDRLPVEMTISLVRGSEKEAPIFYGFARDISERRRGEEQLAYLAYHDALTGLPNRILVEEQLDLALARARRTGDSAALMFVDLDDFKEVNDRLGHAAGDQLLAAVSARLRAVLRDSDMLARQGGDEFLVLLADLSEDPTTAAERVGGKLLDALREPFVVAGTEVRTGASVGISLYPAAADSEALLRHADVAMYRAKGAGGGRLMFHERSASITARRTSISTQMRHAIARGELELHYQPIWRLQPERRIRGVEALLRWRHPDRGLLRPEAFINLAEQGSAADELIEWVLSEACRQGREWRELAMTQMIGVNVSPSQLLAPNFVSRLVDQIKDHGLETASFMVELTESAWSVDAAEVLAVTAKLRAAGLGLALDDFGVGYSSLSRLASLDVDVIKVDRHMLIGVPGDPTAVKVLTAILELATTCGAEIIAEGVEADAQIEFLIDHGVIFAQGFQLAYPMMGSELTSLLARHLHARDAPPRRVAALAQHP
jgi:diguanylate cyclase (GGDEF)-like protein/PAS domain S-box-containing protein